MLYIYIYILCVCKFLHASYVQITFSASKSWSFFQSVSVGAADPDKRPGNLAFFCSVCGFLGKSPPPNCDGCASKNLYHQSLQKFPLEHCHLITAILKNVEGLVLTDFCSTWGLGCHWKLHIFFRMTSTIGPGSSKYWLKHSNSSSIFISLCIVLKILPAHGATASSEQCQCLFARCSCEPYTKQTKLL